MNKAESSLDWDDLLSMQLQCLWDIGCGDNPNYLIGQDQRKLTSDKLGLIKKRLDPDVTDQSIIESGYRGLEELLKYLRLPLKERGKLFSINQERRDKNLASIEEVKKDLLGRAYKAIHPASPIKQSYNELNFQMIWEDFDPRIMSQLVSDPEKSRVPDHLVVMGQGVYQEFISSEGFEAGDLRVFEKYKERCL